MLERFLILSVVMLAGVIAYSLFKQWQLWQVAERANGLTTMKNGTPTILLFTAEYCYPCKSQQLPAIDRLKTEVGENALQVIHVDVESEPEMAAEWGVFSLPTTYILDQEGKPRQVNHGVTSTETLKQQLKTLA